MLLSVDTSGAQRIRNEALTGLINSSNTVFTTANNFVSDSEAVYFNGVRQTEGTFDDFVRSESGGAGTGFDTITFAVAPRARPGVKPDDRVTIDYDLS